MQTKSGVVKLKHVAEAAGVSLSTASRALSGKAEANRISARTEQLVQDAAAKLDFHPSQVARSLRTQKTKLLGVVLPDVANPFFASIAREVTIAAEENGFSVLLADSRGSSEIEQRLIGQLREREIEGLIVSPIGLEQKHLLKLHSAQMPMVLVDRGFSESPLVTVTSDHRSGAASAIKLLTENGHQVIGVLQGIPCTLPNEERLAGIREELHRCGIRFDAQLVQGDQYSELSGYQATRNLLTKRPDITAFFALSNQNALGAIRAITEAGKQIPKDLSLVTFDDSPYAEFLCSPMTTVRQNVSELGKLAAKLIVDQLKTGKKPEKKMYRVPVKVIERASIIKRFVPKC